MENSILFSALLLLGVAVNAQTQDTTQAQTNTTTTVTAITPIPSDFVVPENLKGLTTETLRPEHSFPALGTYNASGSSTESVTITLDETNKGIVWVEGLPQGKIKAWMKRAPSTYKIPAQKTESGKAVSEGTLFLNPDSKELTIVLGRPFDDADPTSFLTIPSKSKVKAWQYTGVKAQ